MNVLLVEDNDEHAELVTFALESRVASVERAEDGEQALRHLLEEKRSFDLVLLDINMPRVSGIEVLERAKATEIGKRTPIVMMTTSASPRDRFLAYHHHANGYTVKPTDFRALEDMLHAVVEFWGKWNRRPELPSAL